MLVIETRPIARLIPYVRNARTHSEAQIAQIAGSIAEFGFVNPVLIGPDDVIVAGHGRVLAALKLGLAEVPVIVLSHLSESQRRALVIADNRIAENAGWDEAMLKAEIAALHEDAFDLDLLGFAEEELGRLLDGLDADAGGAGAADGEPSSDASAETQRATLAARFSIRTGRQFTAARKLGRTHQSVLVFVKGDPRRATEACGEVEFGELETSMETEKETPT